MFAEVAEFTSKMQADSAEFMGKVQALALGLVHDWEPARLYVVRIDNWFGPKWMHFAGKLTVGKNAAIGVHKITLHVPPFVPHRVIAERVFAGPNFEGMAVRPPLHIDCASSLALKRRIADIDREAAFVWFSSESEVQKRGSIMAYLPVISHPPASRTDARHQTGAFYVGFAQREGGWELAMLRGISRGEVAHFEEVGRAPHIS